MTRLLTIISNALCYPIEWVTEAYLASVDKSIDDIIVYCERKKETYEEAKR
jgi:hypothetical protein